MIAKGIEQEHIRGKKLVKFANVLCCEGTEKNQNQWYLLG